VNSYKYRTGNRCSLREACTVVVIFLLFCRCICVIVVTQFGHYSVVMNMNEDSPCNVTAPVRGI